jgi:hypothetical protein
MVQVRASFGHFAEVHLTDPAMLSGDRAGDKMQVARTQRRWRSR